MKRLRNRLKGWLLNEDGVAATEAAFIIPIMVIMLLGVMDVGQGISVNQKVINASQIGASLLARNMSVDEDQVNETIEASELALQPHDTTTFGIDIVSLRFDEDQEPEILWRQTENMAPNNAAINSTAGMFPEGEGLIIVTVGYIYTPVFGNFISGDIVMQEIAFSRGRRSATVQMN